MGIIAMFVYMIMGIFEQIGLLIDAEINRNK